MPTYTMYWPDWMCDRAREQGLEGERLRLLWGGHNQDTLFSRFKVGPGDTVVPVTCTGGVLYALASIDVVEKTTADVWLDRHPEDARLRLHGCGSELLVGAEGKGATLRFDRALTSAQLAAWRYDGSSGERPLKFFDGERLTRPLSLQGVYRVTPATARLVVSVLGMAPAESPKTASTDLETMLRNSPDDERTARVLADGLQDAGDVRGEILTLELDLSTEVDPARAAELDARHAKLMRTTAALKKKPGGFPYRMLMGGRTYVEISATGVRLTASSDRELLETAASLAERTTDARGFRFIEMARRANLRAPPPAVERRMEAARARRTAFLTWSRKKAFSVHEALGLVGPEGDFSVSAVGAVRASDAGDVLAFQASSQWLGSAPESELHLALAERTMTITFRVPLGSPCAEARASHLETLIAGMGATPRVRRLLRTSTHDRET